MKYTLFFFIFVTVLSCKNIRNTNTTTNAEVDKNELERKRILFYQQSKFNMLMPFSDGLSIFSSDTSFGAIDTSGKIVFSLPSENIKSISQYQFGLALLVYKDTLTHYSIEDKQDQFVYIDKTGEIVFDATKEGYQDATEFNKFGYAIVKDKINKKYGIINHHFKPVLPTIFDEIDNIDANRFRVSRNDKYGIVDATNKLLVDFVFGRMEAFTSNKKMFCVKNNGWGIYDSLGRLIHKYNCDELVYTEGLVLLQIIGNKKIDKYAYADTAGKIIVPYGKYSDCGSFSNGLAMVCNENMSSIADSKEYKKQVGYIDVGGKEIVSLQYEDGLSFYQGMASVKKNGKWGYINVTGKVVIDFLYDEFAIFEDGYALVTLKGKEFYIDSTGKKLDLKSFSLKQ